MPQLRSSTRRRFLAEMAGGALTTVAAPGLLLSGTSRAADARSRSDRFALALIGCGEWGAGRLLPALLANPRARVAAVCDVDAQRLDAAVRLTASSGGSAASAHRDFRPLLERDDIDAVVIATPDHWHASMAIAAMETGKDVYCESPLSLTVEEGRRLVATARLYGTVFQTGCSLRSGTSLYRVLLDAARAGRIGRLRRIAVQLEPPPPGAWQRPETPPAHLDWDLWLGPAPFADYTPNRCHGSFRRYADYSGGVVADQGVHFFDLAHELIGADHSGPTWVEARGTFHPDGPFEDPVTFAGRARYGRHGDVELAVNLGPGPSLKLEGEKGWVAASRDVFSASASGLSQELRQRHAVPVSDAEAAHLENWLDCLATRARPAADVEIGHCSTTVCHLFTLALQLQRPLEWNPERQAFPANDPADGLLRRAERAGWRA